VILIQHILLIVVVFVGFHVGYTLLGYLRRMRCVKEDAGNVRVAGRQG